MSDLAFDILDWIVQNILIWVILILLVGLLICVPFVIYGCLQESKRPIFCLKKDDWECSQTRTVTSTSMIMAGKVLVPMTSTHQECVQWSRK